jgi:hypothetical protein
VLRPADRAHVDERFGDVPIAGGQGSGTVRPATAAKRLDRVYT